VAEREEPQATGRGKTVRDRPPALVAAPNPRQVTLMVIFMPSDLWIVQTSL
jgi:hypothetical protein